MCSGWRPDGVWAGLYNYRMTTLSIFSSTADFAEVVHQLAKTASRVETACGEGVMVWHLWGTDKAAQQHPPVVLFHGGSGSWTHWLRNIEFLVAAGRQVLVPDLPGFGDSAGLPNGGDADMLADVLAHGLAQLLGPRACDLVGFSFGGMAAGFLAAQFPARVAKLVLVGAPGLGIKPELDVELKAWRHLADPLQRDAAHRFNLAALMLYRLDAITDLALRLHAANVVRDRMKKRRLARTDALARALPALESPVYAIYGREDVLFRNQTQALRSALQQAKNYQGLTLVEAAGHWVQFERADAFNTALLAVLEA